jgi:hypothetical protein
MVTIIARAPRPFPIPDAFILDNAVITRDSVMLIRYAIRKGIKVEELDKLCLGTRYYENLLISRFCQGTMAYEEFF